MASILRLNGALLMRIRGTHREEVVNRELATLEGQVSGLLLLSGSEQRVVSAAEGCHPLPMPVRTENRSHMVSAVDHMYDTQALACVRHVSRLPCREAWARVVWWAVEYPATGPSAHTSHMHRREARTPCLLQHVRLFTWLRLCRACLQTLNTCQRQLKSLEQSRKNLDRSVRLLQDPQKRAQRKQVCVCV